MHDHHKPASGKFPKTLRLRKHADFQAVYQEGKKQFSGNVTVFYRERSDDAGPRVGFAVSKAMGEAVDRNRIKRRLRAAVQRRAMQLERPVDVVVHPRRSVLTLEFTKIEQEIGRLFDAIQKSRTR